MKIILAALVAATAIPAAAAPAPSGAPITAAAAQDRVVVRERTTVRRTYGPRYRWRTTCFNTYLHGVRHRTCRRTRYRY